MNKRVRMKTESGTVYSGIFSSVFSGALSDMYSKLFYIVIFAVFLLNTRAWSEESAAGAVSEGGNSRNLASGSQAGMSVGAVTGSSISGTVSGNVSGALSSWPVQANDKLVVRLNSAAVSVTFKEKITAVKAYKLDPSLVVQYRDGQLIFEEPFVKSNGDLKSTEMKNSELKTGDSKITESKAVVETRVRKILELEVPALAIELLVVEGSVDLNGLRKDTKVNLQKGRMIVKNQVGGLKLHGLKTDINIEGGSGALHTDLYQSNMKVKDYRGNLELDLFNGELIFDKSNITGNLRATQGVVRLNQCEGVLQFDLGRAQLFTSSWNGRLEGFSQEGPLNIGLGKDFEVIIRTGSAKVNLTPPADSGASVQMTTQEGDIYAPQQYHVSRDNGIKSLRARLKGESSGKNIMTVRSQEGSFYLNVK